MLKTNLREHQLKAVEILEQIQAVCKEHDIEFFLLAGTALGAVRHGGFIPWDDDIDIGMRVSDLEKFNHVMKKKHLDGFVWTTVENNPQHPRFFGKFLYNGNHCIDVFPIVKTANGRFRRRMQWLHSKVIFQIYMRKIKYTPIEGYKGMNRKILFAVSWILALFMKRNWIISIADWNATRYEKVDTEYYINLYSWYPMEKELIRQEWIEELMPIVFEGKEYLVFKDINAYLTHLYGDYMKLPPEHKRVSSHLEIFDV